MTAEGKAPFANPRNAPRQPAAEGPAGDRDRPLSMTVHGIGAREGWEPETQSGAYEQLAAWGLPVSSHAQVFDDLDGALGYIAHWGEHRHDVEHEIDGVVVKVDQVPLQRRLGRHQQRAALGDRPQVPPEEATTSCTTSGSTSAAPAASRRSPTWSRCRSAA
jgi:DNA ligase (NAD+)